MLCYNACIARLDFTDEFHPNTRANAVDNVPAGVEGPHYHSWPKNRRFFRGANTAPELMLAELFTTRGNFESNLRWFCDQVNIIQPDPRHIIELPRRERLI